MKELEIKLPGTPVNADTKTIKVRKTGGRGTLRIYDLLKGAAIAGIGGAWLVAGYAIAIWYKGGEFDIVWMDVARAGVSGLMGYLNYNLFQKAKVVLNAKDLEVEK